MKTKKINKKRKTFWFEHNQDAKGYSYNDNRAIESIPQSQDNLKREIVRRTWNF